MRILSTVGPYKSLYVSFNVVSFSLIDNFENVNVKILINSRKLYFLKLTIRDGKLSADSSKFECA